MTAFTALVDRMRWSPACALFFDKTKGRFRLASIHPGHTLEEVLDNTVFNFDYDANVCETSSPEPERLALLRDELSVRIADPYPKFVGRIRG